MLEEEPAPKGVLVVVPKFMSHDRGWRAPDAEETVDGPCEDAAADAAAAMMDLDAPGSDAEGAADVGEMAD